MLNSRRWDKLSSKVGRVVFKSGEICLQKWGELSSKSEALSRGEFLYGASCLGASCLWGEFSRFLINTVFGNVSHF